MDLDCLSVHPSWETQEDSCGHWFKKKDPEKKIKGVKNVATPRDNV